MIVQHKRPMQITNHICANREQYAAINPHPILRDLIASADRQKVAAITGDPAPKQQTTFSAISRHYRRACDPNQSCLVLKVPSELNPRTKRNADGGVSHNEKHC